MQSSKYYAAGYSQRQGNKGGETLSLPHFKGKNGTISSKAPRMPQDESEPIVRVIVCEIWQRWQENHIARKQEVENAMENLNPMQELFVLEYLKDFNAKEAAIRAGYSSNRAREIGYQLKNKPKIKKAIEEAMEERAKQVKLDAQWVLQRLVGNYERCSQTIPVTDKDGQETGEYKYDATNVNRTLELIGKHIGMFAPESVTNISLPNNPEVDEARDELRKLPDDSRKQILRLIRRIEPEGQGTA